MICSVAFGTSVLAGLESDVVGIGLGAWVLGVIIFILLPPGTYDRETSVANVDIVSVGFILATFIDYDALGTLIRLISCFIVAVCELS